MQVFDGNGQPPQLPITVTFSVIDGQATFAGGTSSAPGTLLGNTATSPALTALPFGSGPVTVAASVDDYNVPSVNFNLTITALTPSQIAAVSGAGQSALTGTTFAQPMGRERR